MQPVDRSELTAVEGGYLVIPALLIAVVLMTQCYIQQQAAK